MWDRRIQDIGIETKDEGDCDVWGAAICWYGNKVGAEYNYCIDSGNNSSAIYRMFWIGDPKDPDSRIETDYSDFVHYEIDWSKPDWETRLLDAMQSFVLERI